MPDENQSLVTGGNDPFLPKLIAGINQATRIDIAVSFVRASGLSLIKNALEDALEADAKVRIITSGYLNINLQLILTTKANNKLTTSNYINVF